MSEELDKIMQDINAIDLGEQSEDPDFLKRRTISNLFIDDGSMMEYLASERFPNDPSAVARYEMRDGDIYYRDNLGDLQKEFERPEDVNVLEDTFYPNLAPATTFAFDLYGGIKGAEKGFEAGIRAARTLPIKHPLAVSGVVLGSTALGGAAGALVVGGVPRTARALAIDQFYNVPPEEIAASLKDLGVSSLFSAIPFGAGPTRNVLDKFRGAESSLKEIMALRKDVQGTIDEAAKLGIDLTPAEAADVVTRSAELQYFLSRQPQLMKVQQFYADRSKRVAEAVSAFADSMGSQVLSGRLSAQEKLVRASNQAMKLMSQKRKDRSKQLYDTVRELEIQVDLSPLVTKIDDVLEDATIPQTKREAFEAFRDTLFYEQNGEKILRTDLMNIHDLRTSDMEKIVKANLDTTIAKDVIGLREEVTQALNDGSPLYDLARRVYDPSKPHLMLEERNSVNRIAKIFKGGDDKKISKALKDIFDPELSVGSLRNAKRILQSADPEVWKDVKSEFLRGQLNNFTKYSKLEQGVPQFTNYFNNPKKLDMMRVLLEPEEFESFGKMIGFMDRAFNRIPRGGSPTQPLQAQEKLLAAETKNLPAKAGNLALTLINTPGRIFAGKIGDDMLRTISDRQTEEYYKQMTDALFDPDAVDNIRVLEGFFDRAYQTTGQGAVRAIDEATDQEDLNYDQEMLEQRQRENLESSMNQIQIPPVGESVLPLPPTNNFDINPAMSPTILPNPQDRELAMRLQPQGIASLG